MEGRGVEGRGGGKIKLCINYNYSNRLPPDGWNCKVVQFSAFCHNQFGKQQTDTSSLMFKHND